MHSPLFQRRGACMQFSQQQNISLTKNLPLDMDEWHSLVKAWDATKENQKKYC